MSYSGKHRAGRLLLLAATILLLVATGCSGQSATPTSDTTDTTSTPATETAISSAAETEVAVYYSVEATGDASGEKLVAYTRTVEATPDLPTATIQAWIDGPTDAEKAEGASFAGPDDVKLIGVTVTDEVAVVDLSKDFAPAGGSAATFNALGQLVFTATDIPGVVAVSIKLDGEPITEFGGEGYDVSKPLTRSDVAGYFVP